MFGCRCRCSNASIPPGTPFLVNHEKVFCFFVRFLKLPKRRHIHVHIHTYAYASTRAASPPTAGQCKVYVYVDAHMNMQIRPNMREGILVKMRMSKSIPNCFFFIENRPRRRFPRSKLASGPIPDHPTPIVMSKKHEISKNQATLTKKIT